MKHSQESLIRNYKLFEEAFARLMAWKELSGDTSIDPEFWSSVITRSRTIAGIVREDPENKFRDIERLTDEIGNLRYKNSLPPIYDFDNFFDRNGRLKNAAIWVRQDWEADMDEKYSPNADNPYPWVNLISHYRAENEEMGLQINESKTYEMVEFALSRDLEVTFNFHAIDYPMIIKADKTVSIKQVHFLRNNIGMHLEMGQIIDKYCVIEYDEEKIQIGKTYQHCVVQLARLMDQIKYALDS